VTVDLRTRLIRAAEDEIADSGPARASLRAIARRCGVSHQATAHHFADRAGLFTALATEGAGLLYERTLAAMDGVEVAGGRQVAAAGSAYVAFALDRPTLFDVMLRPELLHLDDPELVAARERHRELVFRTIAAAQETGWAAGVPTEEVATLGWATVHGLAVLRRDQVVSVVYPEVDLDAVLARVIDVLDAIS